MKTTFSGFADFTFGLALAASAAAAVVLSGCVSYSDISSQAKLQHADEIAGVARVDAPAAWPKADWWRDFNDPVLSALIETALTGNPDIRVAEARVRLSSGIAGVALSTTKPQVSASGSVTHERFSEHGQVPAPYAGTVQDQANLQLSGSWEVDFFGKNAELLASTLGSVKAAEVNVAAARVMLSNDIARHYFALAERLAQLALLRELEKNHQANAALLQSRYQAGLDNKTALQQATAGEAMNRRDIEGLQDDISVRRNAIAALLGQGPGQQAGLSPELYKAQNSLPDVPDHLSANLLGRRPDVTAARWRVEQSLHGLKAYQANFYPNVNLRAFVGLNSIGLDNLFDMGSRTPGIGAAISLPIFDGGRLRSTYSALAADADSAIESYNSTLLSALHFVADQLAAGKPMLAQIDLQETAQKAAETNLALVRQRYQAGIGDYATVLAAERILITQRQSTADYYGRQLGGIVKLIRALGSGYTDPELAHNKQTVENIASAK